MGWYRTQTGCRAAMVRRVGCGSQCCARYTSHFTMTDSLWAGHRPYISPPCAVHPDHLLSQQLKPSVIAVVYRSKITNQPTHPGVHVCPNRTNCITTWYGLFGYGALLKVKYIMHGENGYGQYSSRYLDLQALLHRWKKSREIPRLKSVYYFQKYSVE
jgi:hypothetical protein